MMVASPPAAPSATPELDEVIDAAFGLTIRLKSSVSAESPGGKKLTLDELVTSVTDGRVRTSIEQLLEAIEAIVHGDRPNPIDLVEILTRAILDFVGHLREAIADGFQVTDLLAGVTDGGIRQDLQRAFDGVEKIQIELQNINMWAMFALVQRVSAWIPRVIGAGA